MFLHVMHRLWSLQDAGIDVATWLAFVLLYYVLLEPYIKQGPRIRT